MFSYSRKIYIGVIILENKRADTTKAVLNLSCRELVSNRYGLGKIESTKATVK